MKHSGHKLLGFLLSFEYIIYLAHLDFLLDTIRCWHLILQRFNVKTDSSENTSVYETMEFRVLQGPEKLRQVTKLLETLENDLSTKSLNSAQRTQTLLQLRQHGTNPDNAGPIYSKRGIDILSKYGVDGESTDVRRAALRCVANALLLDSNMRQLFVDTGRGGKLAEMLKVCA
ncbi:Putative Resistance to inhibitor of cholinesterase 8 [Aspergillus calidoustus]|uniref:Putative Resistance to inhibitor of cholinesterase 8 n=1 Tax=Aspergillus calidoustus TaxID=454130 RepID=A0A0U5GFN2_ASPCI|nr:Putative Resistance to inhibitor of cholinesterase 8 [Aspergillus calidoustus]